MSAAKRFDTGKISELYKHLRTLKKDEWDRDAATLGKELIGYIGADAAKKMGATPKSLGGLGKLFARVASQTSEEEFKHSFQTGEIPAMKLTPEEMEALRGGSVGSIIGPALSFGGQIFGAIGQGKQAQTDFTNNRSALAAQAEMKLGKPATPEQLNTLYTANGVGDSQRP